MTPEQINRGIDAIQSIADALSEMARVADAEMLERETLRAKAYADSMRMAGERVDLEKLRAELDAKA
jgi:hypothetical protein